MAMGQDHDGFDGAPPRPRHRPADAGALGAMARALFVGRAPVRRSRFLVRACARSESQSDGTALQLAHCAALLRDFVRGEAAASRAIELQQAALSGQEGVLSWARRCGSGHLRALQGRTAEAIAAYMQETRVPE